MTSDEYWLSAYYAHQGQEKPDQPDNSWSPWTGSSGGNWGVGGFEWGGWGDLIPDGEFAAVASSGGYEYLSVPLGRWKVAHSILEGHFDWAARESLFQDWQYFSSPASVSSQALPGIGTFETNSTASLPKYRLTLTAPYPGLFGPQSGQLSHGTSVISGGHFNYSQPFGGFVSVVWLSQASLEPTWAMPSGYRYTVSLSASGGSTELNKLSVVDHNGTSMMPGYASLSTGEFAAPQGASIGVRSDLSFGLQSVVDHRLVVRRRPI